MWSLWTDNLLPLIGAVLPIDGSTFPAIRAALGLSLLWLGPGLAWAWLIPDPDQSQRGFAATCLMATARMILIGTVLISLTAVGLAEIGRFSHHRLVGMMIGWMIAGIGIRLLLGRVHLKRELQSAAPGVLVTIIALTALFLLPDRGNWIAGGWDPGIYVGQGVMVHRTGTFHPSPDALLASMSDETFAAFTREANHFLEYQPVVPVDPDTRAILPFFFRLFPAIVCVLYDVGGLDAAMRVNLVLGWLAWLLFAGLLIAHRRSPFLVVGACLLLATHPVWVFMLHFPTTELLQFLLVCGLGLLLPYRFQSRWPAWVTALVLVAGVVNRFSFFPFAGLYLCLCTWMDLPREHRDPVFRMRLLHTLVLLAAALFDAMSCRVTLNRLDDLVLPLVIGGVGLCGIALVVEVLAFHHKTRRILAKPGAGVVVLGLAAAVLAGWSVEQLGYGSVLQNVSLQAQLAMPFLGPLLVIAALAGVLVFVSRNESTRCWSGFVLFLVAVTIVTFNVDAISKLYPWAMRRHLAYTVPLLCILATLPAMLLWNRVGRQPLSKAMAVLYLALLIAYQAPTSLDAMRHTELQGLADVMSDIANQIGDEDVVIADHFRWGTPLTLIHGKRVLNGELLWTEPDETRTKHAFAAFRAWHDQGRRVVFVTSTPKGLAVFPGAVHGTAVWSSGEVDLTELNHHRDQTGFSTRSRTKEFTVWEWTPK